MKVGYTTAARFDLVGIGAWIASDNPVRAESFVSELQKACDALGCMPRAFQVIIKRGKSQIRRKPYFDYLIFYRIKQETVEILHVLHGARDYEAVLFPK